jgi:hypothetical protein
MQNVEIAINGSWRRPKLFGHVGDTQPVAISFNERQKLYRSQYWLISRHQILCRRPIPQVMEVEVTGEGFVSYELGRILSDFAA